MNADEERIARKKAFVDWWVHQHAEETATLSAAILCGKTVRLAYNPETQRVMATVVEARER